MSVESWQRRNRGEACEFVIKKLEGFGLRVDASSRLGTLRRLFFEKDGTPRGIIPRDDADFEFALEGQRDLNQLSFAFDVLPNDFLRAHTSRLRLLLKDPSLPQDASKSSCGRDTQAELYAAAICWRAGLSPVTLDEPDVRCTHRDMTFGLAVKRLKKNQNRLQDRVKDAASQIQRSKLPGLVVLDTSLVGNPANNRLWQPVPQEVFGASYKLAMDSFFVRYVDSFRDWVRGKGVRGIVVMDSQIRLAMDGQWEHCGMNAGILTEVYNMRRRKEFESLWSAMQRGIPNLVAQEAATA